MMSLLDHPSPNNRALARSCSHEPLQQQVFIDCRWYGFVVSDRENAKILRQQSNVAEKFAELLVAGIARELLGNSAETYDV